MNGRRTSALFNRWGSLILFFCLFLVFPGWAQIRINSVTSAKNSVSKGQTGIPVAMEIENIGGTTVSLSSATLTFSLGIFDVTCNTSPLPSLTPGGRTTINYTVSVSPVSPSVVTVISGSATCIIPPVTPQNDNSADLTHNWTVQEPSELVINTILGAANVNRGSMGNRVIMDIGKSGEAGVWLNNADLSPTKDSFGNHNYTSWTYLSPTLPQNFSRNYWWNSKWARRKQISITNSSLSTLPVGYEIKFSFNHSSLVTAGNSLANGNDIRIVYDNGVSYVDLTRFLGSDSIGLPGNAWNTATTTIWFRLQSALPPSPSSTDRYALYYKASAADAASPLANPQNVFVYYYDFEGAAIWTSFAIRMNNGNPYPTPWTWIVPNTGPTTAHSGTRVWQTVTAGGNQYGNNRTTYATESSWLHSPAINLVGKLNPTLSYFDYYQVAADFGDYGVLRVYRDPFSRVLLTPIAYNTDQHATWKQQVFSLAAVNDETINLEYMWLADNGTTNRGWAIDDVWIRQVANPEPNNPVLGVEENVPLLPTIKAYFDVDVKDTATPGMDIVDGVASGTEVNTEEEISDLAAATPLSWNIKGQNFMTYGNAFYLSGKDTFNVGETVYGKGTGYTPNTSYNIKWYDPSGILINTNTVVSNSSGILYQNRVMSASDVAGKWSISVENLSGTTQYALVYFNLNIPTNLQAVLTVPDMVVSGAPFTLTMTVNNVGQSGAVGVKPSEISPTLGKFGGGTLGALTGPNPSSEYVPGGGNAVFTWTGVAGSPGQVWFRGNASGTIEGSSVITYSASAGSNICTIASEGFLVYSVTASDSTVNRGQTGLPVVTTVVNTGNVDVTLATISLNFNNGGDVTSSFQTAVVNPSIPTTLPGNPYPPWWNTSYLYRQELRVSGDANSYAPRCSSEIRNNLDSLVASGKLLANYNDFRVAFWNDSAKTWTELDRDVVATDSTWFMIQRTLDCYAREEGYYIYYGNPAAGAPPRVRDNVYFLFQDWEGGAYGTGYNQILGGTAGSPEALAASGFTNAAGAWSAHFTNNLGNPNANNGVVLVDTQTKGGLPLQIDSQAICFRNMDFPGGGGVDTIYGDVYVTFNATLYPKMKVSYWHWMDNGIDTADYEKVDFWDGAWHLLTTYIGNAADDQLFHQDTYNLWSYGTLTAGNIVRWRANFSNGGSSDNERGQVDNICLMMEAPQAIALAEETQPVATMPVNFTVAIDVTAPSGVTTIDSRATSTSLIATGTYVDTSAAPRTAVWTINTETVETFADAALTVPKNIFNRGDMIYVWGKNFNPDSGTLASVKWYDGYPATGTLINSSNNRTILNASFTASYQPVAGSYPGIWRLAIDRGGGQLATGSFRLIDQPVLMPRLVISPATATVFQTFTANLTVDACSNGNSFENDSNGVPPVGWTITKNPVGATAQSSNSATYNYAPSNLFFQISHNAVITAVNASITWPMHDVYSPVLHFDYSLILPGPGTLTAIVSPNGWITTTSVATYNTSLGAKNWQTVAVALPANMANNRSTGIGFKFSAAAANSFAFIDNVYVTGLAPNFESVSLQPVSWASSTSGTGEAINTGAPTPGLTTITCGSPVTFSGVYSCSLATSTLPFYLHGIGTPLIVASGTGVSSNRRCNASETYSNGIAILRETLSVTPDPTDFGTVSPGSVSASKSLTITNTGDVQLDFVSWEFHNLSTDTFAIPYQSLGVEPDPVGMIAKGTNIPATISLYVPPGTPVGSYSAYQFAFEDNNSDGLCGGEPIGQFNVKVSVPRTELLQTNTASFSFGTWLQNDTSASVSVLVSNIGNVDLNTVRFIPWDFVATPGYKIASSNVNLIPVFLGKLVVSDGGWDEISVRIPANASQPHPYVGTGTFIDDKNANGKWDPGEACATISMSIAVGGLDTLTVGSATVVLPSGIPGSQVQTGTIRINNTGSVAQTYLKFQLASLTYSTYEIPIANIEMIPTPLASITPGASTTFTVSTLIPFGVASSPGATPYTGVQKVFNDRNQNGVPDIGEASRTFILNLGVNLSRNFTISEVVANFGAGPGGMKATTTVDVINLGNASCTTMKWKELATLRSGVNTISAANITITPTGFHPTTWTLVNTETDRIATLSLSVPGGQANGIYLGRWCLIDDRNANNASDTGEAYDEFDLRVEIGNSTLDIVENLVQSTGYPAGNTTPKVFSVSNTGNITLTNLKYVKADLPELTFPAQLILIANQIFSAPDPIGLLGIGVTTNPNIYFSIPPNKQIGTYSAKLKVYQDDNGNGAADVGEASDTLTLEVDVLGKRLVSLTPAPFTFGAVSPGALATGTLDCTNLGNKIASLSYSIADMFSGGNSISKTQIAIQPPETPWLVNWTGTTSETATLTITVPGTTPTGVYTGTITFWEDTNMNSGLDVGEDSWIATTTVSVGSKDLVVLEAQLDFGSVDKGSDSASLNFNVRNMGTVALDKTKIASSALFGPVTIPTSNLHFGAAGDQITPPNLNPAVTRSVSLWVHTDLAYPSGFYNGIQKVYEDNNANGVPDVGEASDTFNVRIAVVAPNLYLLLDPGAFSWTIKRGQAATGSFAIDNVRASLLTSINYTKNPLIYSIYNIPAGSINFTPAPGYSINPYSSSFATVTVTVPPTQAAGVYTGLQNIYDSANQDLASSDLNLTVTVPPAGVSLAPTSIDLGFVNAVDGNSATGSFVVTSTGLATFPIGVIAGNLVGPSMSIPLASLTFTFVKNSLDVAPDSTNATVSVLVDGLVMPGTYIGTATINDSNFPDEASRTLTIKLTVPNRIGDYVYQPITNLVTPGSVASNTKYFITAYVLASASLSVGNPVIQVREWSKTDSMIPLATHTFIIPRTLLTTSPNLDHWVRVGAGENSGDLFSFTTVNTDTLGTITVELGFDTSAVVGDTVLFDAIQLEKAMVLKPQNATATHPAPWASEKGVVSPNTGTDVRGSKPYYAW